MFCETLSLVIVSNGKRHIVGEYYSRVIDLGFSLIAWKKDLFNVVSGSLCCFD